MLPSEEDLRRSDNSELALTQLYKKTAIKTLNGSDRKSLKVLLSQISVTLSDGGKTYIHDISVTEILKTQFDKASNGQLNFQNFILLVRVL